MKLPLAKTLTIIGAMAILTLFSACNSQSAPEMDEATLEEQVQQVQEEERAHFDATQDER